MRFFPVALNSCLTIAASAAFSFLYSSCVSQPRAVSLTTAVANPRVIGEIAVVDEAHRFVLVDLDSYLYVPEPGTPLRAIDHGTATAHLKASPEQKRPFIAADILDGRPGVGDQVVQ